MHTPPERARRRRMARSNELEVRALGWVLTRDLYANNLHRRLGWACSTSAAMFASLVRRWRELRQSPLADRHGVLDTLLWGPQSALLSPQGEIALHHFVRRLQRASEAHYGSAALTERLRNASTSALAFGVLCIAFAEAASPAMPLLDDAALTAFLIATLEFVHALQLRRVRALVRRVGGCESEPAGADTSLRRDGSLNDDAGAAPRMRR